jgi:hypothetical protein
MNPLTEQQRDARAELLDALRSEVLGPAGGEEEVLEQRPTTRYLLGRLAPSGTMVAAEEDDGAGDAGADDDDADTGSSGPISMAMNPSSIGLSFVVAADAGPLEVVARWGHYEPNTGSGVPAEPSGELATPGFEEGRAATESKGVEAGRKKQRTVHQRSQFEFVVPLDPSASSHPPVDVAGDGVNVEFLVRTRSDGVRAVSVFLVNRRETLPGDRFPPDDKWLLQPELIVRSVSGSSVFEARGIDDLGGTDDTDVLSNELLYWDRPEFAVGHGCAAGWDAEPGSRRAWMVCSEIVPSWELARIDPRDDVDAELEMWALGGSGDAGVPGARLREMLMPLADSYGNWIDEELVATLLPRVPPELRDTAEEHIESCRIAHERMVEGIKLLADGPLEARQAFCFANRAMALQRERTQISLARRRGETLSSPTTPRWRPFQIAFVLINLAPMADRHHPYRDVADLLWFPTGGGKTEAYLGLTAFALAHRRTRQRLNGYRTDAGVTVLMRYTLRLLTIQQFQRATALICACEHLRTAEGSWGEEPFSIGLWVGQSATPNRYSTGDDKNPGAKEILELIKKGHKVPGGKGTPVQLLSCPWCGATLDPTRDDYDCDDEGERILIHCPDDDCEFGFAGDGIPAHTVDQQLYRNVPSLVIATVDKFAQMPFNGRTQALFGKVQRRCPRHGFLTEGEGSDHKANKHIASAAGPAVKVAKTFPLEPPDLIIQDELHLISGPLGTLVGLYETAIDTLCSVDIDGTRVTPKVVASTATIRRAHQQVGALFNRKLQIFPPSGLKSTDSWFGREVPTIEEPGRMYLGIYAPGKSVKTALVRVYAALLSKAQALRERDAAVGDPYMTLVGYFNSLRELGGAIRLVEDDVPGRIKVLHRRDAAEWPTRYLNLREELTSNKKADEVPKILGMLERRFTDGKPPPNEYPVDTLMASNMISVGVDIDRLGLMVVNGQPKTTAEYIQATSRVGRQSPGLVVTVYNWTRPRDTSHYERFRSYHGALYRQVEATSVTPFSARARDKGLAGVLTALIRLGDPAMTPQQNAGRLDRTSPWVAAACSEIERRARLVTGDDGPDVGARTREELNSMLDDWEKAVLNHDGVCWTRAGLPKRKKGETAPSSNMTNVVDAQGATVRDGIMVAPESLREVESEIHVWLADELFGGATKESE